MNGLIPHYYHGEQKGTVHLGEQNLADTEIHELAGTVGTVFQNPKSQFFAVNAFEEMAFGCENMGLPREETARRLTHTVEKFGIAAIVGKSLFKLSGGEKQKIACASVSAMFPNVILLDEPSSNLDSAAIHDLRRFIETWRQAGKTIVVAEHRLYYLEGLVDRVLYMCEGKIINDTSGARFFDKSSDEMALLGLRSLTPFKSAQIEKRRCEVPSGTIKFRDFVYSYKGSLKNALSIREVEVPAHQIIALIGHNGAGKTTFARCSCGLEKRMKGSIEYAGQSYRGKKLAQLSFMVMQNVDYQLFAESVEEELHLCLHGKSEEESKAIVHDILIKLNITPKKNSHPQTLSGGEKQRLAIGCALASSKKLLFFDEPTSGLDHKHMLIVSNLLKQLQEEGTSIFLITHDSELIFNCCTHYLHIDQGKVCSQGRLDRTGSSYLTSFFEEAGKNEALLSSCFYGNSPLK
jgi:energy-coupling factor transport system ATP-binding protein